MDLEEAMIETPTLEERLRFQFSERMGNSKAAVFSDFDTYAKSLPRRVVAGVMEHTVLALYQLPFWADKQAVTTMALDFESNRRKLQGERNFARYATAPTQSGKTASILPAFLDSAEGNRSIDGVNVSFSYYIYLAFDNNDNRCFRARTAVQGNYYEQGAFFMLQFLQMFFRNEFGEAYIENTGSGSVPSLLLIQTEMKKVLKSNAPQGRCLIHLDEHRSMLRHADEKEAALFRKGAIETLAEIPGVIIVATYTKVLTEVDPAGSSKVCRYPVAVPLLDIDAMTRSIPEFDMHLPERCLTGSEAALVSSVRFHLAQKITSIGLLSLHGVVEVTQMNELRRAFQGIVESENELLRNRLIRLHQLLVLDFSYMANAIPNADASLLLCGVPEQTWNSSTVERQVSNILLTSNGLVTARLNHLLQMVDPSSTVYSVGASHFAATLTGQNMDLLSSTPLEAAYAWVISILSAKDRRLIFGQNRFEIQCEALVGGRLFVKSMREDFSERFDALETNKIYFALEGPDSGFSQYHPLCDLYFVTVTQQLVLIDVTAFNDEEFKEKKPNKLPVNTKRNRMIAWIKLHMENYNSRQTTLHGIVLAPFDTGVSEYAEHGRGNTLQVLRGTDAVIHLGGLSQFLFWYASPRNIEVQEEVVEE